MPNPRFWENTLRHPRRRYKFINALIKNCVKSKLEESWKKKFHFYLLAGLVLHFKIGAQFRYGWVLHGSTVSFLTLKRQFMSTGIITKTKTRVKRGEQRIYFVSISKINNWKMGKPQRRRKVHYGDTHLQRRWRTRNRSRDLDLVSDIAETKLFAT